MFGANMLMMNPKAAIPVPRIVTNLHPNLFTKILAIGPGKQNNASKDN